MERGTLTAAGQYAGIGKGTKRLRFFFSGPFRFFSFFPSCLHRIFRFFLDFFNRAV